MGRCVLEASQKQPVFKQVAGSQLSQVFGVDIRRIVIVNAEIKMAARRGNAKPELFFIAIYLLTLRKNWSADFSPRFPNV